MLTGSRGTAFFDEELNSNVSPPSDPTEIKSVAVKTDEVVQALELNQTSAKRAVLRVTPPFSGRMRARVHVVQDHEEIHDQEEIQDHEEINEGSVSVRSESENAHDGIENLTAGEDVENDPGEAQPAPVRIDPSTILSESCPSYPRPAETEDELRADPDVKYTVERHHDRHTAAVREWRKRLPSAIKDRIPIEIPGGTHEVDVVVLGQTE